MKFEIVWQGEKGRTRMKSRQSETVTAFNKEDAIKKIRAANWVYKLISAKPVA